MAVILIDLDGTVRNVWQKYKELAKFVTFEAVDWPADGPKNYWFLEEMKNHPKIAQLQELWVRQHLFESLLPYTGAVENVKKLGERHIVFLVTQPAFGSDHAASENVRWVREHFGTAWENALIQTYDRTLLQGDILIDDKPDIFGVMKYPTWTHIVFDQPYNRKDRYAARLLKWSHVHGIVAKLINR